MGLKEKLFVIVLILIILFPFFFTKKEIKIKEKIKLPYIIVNNGNFQTYNGVLKKDGNFQRLDFFNQNLYITENLKLKFFDKNSTLLAKKIIFNNIYSFFNAKYITNKFTFVAENGTYDDKNKILIAYNFKFFNDEIEGKGNKMSYQNGIIKADNILYILKGLK